MKFRFLIWFMLIFGGVQFVLYPLTSIDSYLSYPIIMLLLAMQMPLFYILHSFSPTLSNEIAWPLLVILNTLLSGAFFLAVQLFKLACKKITSDND